MSFSSVERPDTTEARQGPSPTAQHPPLCKKTPAPSGERLRGTGHLAYVVEGHASACPRTVGVDASRGALTLEVECSSKVK